MKQVKGEQHVILQDIQANRLAGFLRERAHGIPPDVRLGANLFPAFKPGEATGVRATIQVTAKEGPALMVADRFGHGLYHVFDIRTVESVTILTNAGSTVSATRDGASFEVRVFMKSTNNLSVWAPEAQWEGGPLPAVA